MKVACVVGARPNFMKIGPVIEAMRGLMYKTAENVDLAQNHPDPVKREAAALQEAKTES